MAYLTNADIVQRLGALRVVQLTDDAQTGAADDALVTSLREAAEAEVNSYLARRYLPPVDVVEFPELAPVLAAVTLDVVEYRLHARRPPVPDDVQRRYRQTLAWLAAVGAGETALPTDREVPLNQAAGPVAQAVGDVRRLSQEEMERL